MARAAGKRQTKLSILQTMRFMVDQNRSNSTDHSQRHATKIQGPCMFNYKDLEKKAVLALDLALACEQSLDTHTHEQVTEHLSLGREPTLLAILGELARMEIAPSCIILFLTRFWLVT